MSIKKGYGSDLIDTQWEQLKKYLPKAKSGGRPREVDLREIMNAIFYINKTSCPWRWLPKDYSPWQTVYSYFRSWRLSGAWEKNQLPIEQVLEEKRGKKFNTLRGVHGLSVCEDYFCRRNKGLRWWEKGGWPQTPHSSGYFGVHNDSGCTCS